MAAWWQPTADGYFQHVPKAAILEAVGEFAPEHVTRLAKLKKGDIASEAERLADGTGWMPAIFAVEATQQNAQEVVTDEEAEAQKEATIREAEGNAEAIMKVQQANADGIRFLKEAGADEAVLTMKSLEAFAKAADGKATKIIIPSEIQSIAGLVKSVTEIGADDKKEEK